MTLRKQAEKFLKSYLDPEIGLDIWTLGFVRKLEVDEGKRTARILMTLTSPMCPFGRTMAADIGKGLKKIGLRSVRVELSFDPPWEPSAEVRAMLGL